MSFNPLRGLLRVAARFHTAPKIPATPTAGIFANLSTNITKDPIACHVAETRHLVLQEVAMDQKLEILEAPIRFAPSEVDFALVRRQLESFTD